MRQVLQHLGDGGTLLIDAPAPGPHSGSLLIQTTRSLVSAGTERMLVDFGRAGWIGKARRQPEKVRAVIAKIRSNGLRETLRAVRAKLHRPIPLGYCQVGQVVDAGGADWIAAGERAVSNGPHAGTVSVVHGLCAKIPNAVSDDAATFTPLAAIALQGINLLSTQAGDRVVVCGLGLIGQLAVRILRAQGYDVLGLDPDPVRRKIAQTFGAHTPVGDSVAMALAFTSGQGVAGVLITASTDSNEIVNQAARSCRRRGKVVLVGVVGLHLNRADFYRNEVSFQVSRSYGRREPGMVDSAATNFRRVLACMAEGRLPVDDLITHRFPFGQAPSAYGALSDRSALGIVMQYDGEPAAAAAGKRSTVLARSVELMQAPVADGRPRVALIGAGNFATRVLLPALSQAKARPLIMGIASAQGINAMLAAKAFGAGRATTDSTRLFADPDVEAIIIATRHDEHARSAIQALAADKHVWVEKPLALASAELDAVVAARREANRMVMVGFNRRFAPMAVALRTALAQRRPPRHVMAIVNAGQLEVDHWTLDLQVGGGRIVGEACHFVDLLRYWVGAPIEGVRCMRRDTDGQDGGCFELRFANGSTGVVDYRTDLPAHLPKERFEIDGEGYSARLDNWTRLTSEGLGGLALRSGWGGGRGKGHSQAIDAFLAAMTGGAAPIAFDEILEVSRWSILMQQMKRFDQGGTETARGDLGATVDAR